MARIRYIKPGFFTDADIGDLEPLDRLFFQGLWCYADRDGRLPYRPRELGVQVLPWDTIDAEAALHRLAEAKFIIIYSTEGDTYIQVRTWKKHQRPHHTERKSVIPPLDNGSLTVTLQDGMGMGMGVKGMGKTGTGTEEALGDKSPVVVSPPRKKRNKYPEAFERFWKAFPPARRKKKPQTLKRWYEAVVILANWLHVDRPMAADHLVQRATDYAASDEGRGEYVRGPEPWLNQQAWEDEPEAWTRPETTEPAGPKYEIPKLGGKP